LALTNRERILPVLDCAFRGPSLRAKPAEGPNAPLEGFFCGKRFCRSDPGTLEGDQAAAVQCGPYFLLDLITRLD